MEEIQNEEGIEENSPLLDSNRSVKNKVPEVEIHLYRQGKGPVAVFRSALGGWEQDQLEVQDILDKYGLTAIYALNPDFSRSVSIRFNPKNGRSLLSYKDGTIIHIDGEPKDPMMKPFTKILVGVAVMVSLIALLYSENPTWLKKFNLKGTRIPPWLITCAVIVFTRLRKRTKDFPTNRGC